MMVIEFGWNNKFVLKTSDAVKLLELLEKAEMYEDKWRKAEEGGTTYHVYPLEPEKVPSLKLISDDLYRMAKLAGKPEKEQ
jgi:predicted DNA-binding ArsR family transcriptional regulator